MPILMVLTKTTVGSENPSLGANKQNNNNSWWKQTTTTTTPLFAFNIYIHWYREKELCQTFGNWDWQAATLHLLYLPMLRHGIPHTNLACVACSHKLASNKKKSIYRNSQVKCSCRPIKGKNKIIIQYQGLKCCLSTCWFQVICRKWQVKNIAACCWWQARKSLVIQNLSIWIIFSSIFHLQ